MADLDSLLQTAADSIQEAPTSQSEPVPAPAPEAPKPRDPFSAKFAALSRKERQHAEERRKFQAEKAEWEKQRSSSASPDDLIAEFKKNPIKFGEKYGITYDELIKMGLNEGNPTVEMMLQRQREEMDTEYGSKLSKLEQMIAEKEAKEAEAQLNGVKQGFIDQISSFIDSNEQEYELVKMHNAVEDVYSVCEEFYNRTGQNLDLEVAVQKVEEHLLAQAEKLMQSKKLKSKFAPPEESLQVTPRTLSNTHAAEVPVSHQNQQLSRSQLIADSVKNLRFKS